MFYQFCDLEVPEAQDLIKTSLKSPGSKCDEKSGWFEDGIDARDGPVAMKIDRLEKIFQIIQSYAPNCVEL